MPAKAGAPSVSNVKAVFNASNGYIGVWHLGREQIGLSNVARAGRYRFTLRRAPIEAPQPTAAVKATVRVGDASAEAKCDPKSNTAVVEIDLPAARCARLEAPDGKHGAALFVEVERLSP